MNEINIKFDSPKSHTFRFKLFDVIDLMLKPAVGVVMCGVSSFAKCRRIVVFPELSRPMRIIRNSLSDDDLSFLSSDNKPFNREKSIIFFCKKLAF